MVFSRKLKYFIPAQTRAFSGPARVTILGAETLLGQLLAVLLKKSRYVKVLALYDSCPSIHGIACDISHMNTPTVLKAFCGPEMLSYALKDTWVTVLAGGSQFIGDDKPMDLFYKNAPFVCGMTQAYLHNAPTSMFLVATEPINYMVPYIMSVLRKMSCFESRKVVGLMEHHSLRSRTFISEFLDVPPETLAIPIVGGTSSETIMPIFSQMIPCWQISNNALAHLITMVKSCEACVQCGHKKDRSAYFTQAIATSRFVENLIRAMNGEENIFNYAFVRNQFSENIQYFGGKLLFDIHGIANIYDIPQMNEWENTFYKAAIDSLTIEMKQCNALIKNL